MWITLAETEYQMTAMRAQGAGGQNVNKVSSAIHLRFDIKASSLSPEHKLRLLALRDARISSDGVLVIKAQQFRTQQMNKQDAITRLHALVNSVAQPPSVRHATKPTYSSKQKRLQHKTLRGAIKASRSKLGCGKIAFD